MGDEFQLGSGSWWDSSSRNRFESRTTPATSSTIPTTLNAIASFGWPTEMVDMKSRSDDQSSAAAAEGGGGGGGVLSNPNLQMVGLGLSSQSMDWNQALLSEKGEGSFRSLLQEDIASNGGDFPPESGDGASSWREKLMSSSENEFKQINRGFSLDQQQFSSQATSNDRTITSSTLTTAFPVNSVPAYGHLLPENQQQSNYQNRPISNYPYHFGAGYGGEMIPSINKHLHFTNNTPLWNASAAMNDGRSSFFPPAQTQIHPAPSSETKPKNKTDVGTKKSSTETSNKRSRNETASPLPAFKVRKEKMGDRITALQQLVSPFGKTDTASVLSEAIEYIKFLHEQLTALSAPYMKNGAPMQNQQHPDKSKDPEGPRQDLRTRGLCLVPVSSTFPVTHETAVDFWTPTFGGTFR